MLDADATKGLRDRLAGGTEDRLGKAIIDLFDNPLLNGALGRASDAREKAAQAQELAMGALNLPSAADVERLTRRLRSISQRLEGIEDGVHRLRTPSGASIETRLAAIEEQLRALSGKLDGRRPTGGATASNAGAASARTSAAKRSASKGSGSAAQPAAASKRSGSAAKRGPAPKRSAAKASKPAR